MKTKVKGSMTIEATMVLPVILLGAVLLIFLISKEYSENIKIAKAQAVITLSNDFRYLPVVLKDLKQGTGDADKNTMFMMTPFNYSDEATVINVPVINGYLRSETRMLCRAKLKGVD